MIKMQSSRGNAPSPARDVAYTALCCALLIGSQTVLSAVVGVEVVTVIFVCFSSVFGIRRGVLCAVAFSLLRCITVGFMPNVMALYLIYYPLLALVFGALGHIKQSVFDNCRVWLIVAVNAVLLGIASACALSYALELIKISRLYKATVNAMLWVIFSLAVALAVVFDILCAAVRKGNRKCAVALRVITFTAVAAVCTVCFTLLDDIITPLMLGYSRGAALAYFYASFTAMLPQTVCTVVTVGGLYLPLSHALGRAVRSPTGY